MILLSTLFRECREMADNCGFEPRFKFDSRYTYHSILGSGSGGEVIKCYDSVCDKYVALKRVGFDNRCECYSEIQMLQKIKGEHKCFLSFDRSFVCGSDIYIVTEVAEGMELYYLMNRQALDLLQIKKVFLSIVEAMTVAHKMGITHRDLKTENIMVDNVDGELEVKIIDWGYATCGEATHVCGSPHYIAPELLSRRKPLIGPHNDVWSLGVILYGLLTAHAPFWGQNNADLFRHIRGMSPGYDTQGLTSGAVRLLRKIFRPSSKRITCEEMLKDEWLLSMAPEKRFYRRAMDVRREDPPSKLICNSI